MLAGLLGSTARARILELLLLNPKDRYYLRQIAVLADLAVRSVQQEMARLAKIGVVSREEDGNRVYFRANPACPVLEELKALVLKSSGVGDVLRHHLAAHAGAIRCAFIFGSYAKRKEEAWSDIDLFVIGDISSRTLGELVFDAQTRMGRPINPVHYGLKEFGSKVRSKDPFVTSVLKGPKIFLVGGADELKQAAQKQADR
jgi:predicted nucleotidyltransferase